MNIYLDINGVLVTNSMQTAFFADDFINYILKKWPNSTYWLTSHCWRGQDNTNEVLRPHIKHSTLVKLKLIKPTDWRELKTDAIDFRQPFLWFDDNLYSEEKSILEHYNALKCHRKIDLKKDPGQLMDEIAYLKTL